MNCARASRVFRTAVFVCLASSIVMASATAQGQQPKTSPVEIAKEQLPVVIERAFPNLRFERPIYLTSPRDGTNRVAVMGELGHVWIFPNKEDVEEAKELLDISANVVYKDKENEEGLLGLAFHPKFKENGEFFVYYTTTGAKHTSVLKRFKVSKDDPNKADPNSGEEIFRTPEKPDWNHNGGTIIFGPDGYLYIAIGDGGAANDPYAHGQALNTILGKILRIDIDHKDPGLNYAIPKDNPFVGTEGARGEIWALGLRNVWRMAFDPQTKWLWAGEVGQNTWEEIDIITKGGNYGWNIREGFHSFPEKANMKPTPGPAPEKPVGKLIDPIFDYHHSLGKSVTGGNVYRGKSAPELVGKYLFADYVSGKVYALTYDDKAEKTTSVQQLQQEEGRTMPVFSFGTDENNETYLMTTEGVIKRFRSAKPETPTSTTEKN
jgi:glucose/arabinose dehydrogenase